MFAALLLRLYEEDKIKSIFKTKSTWKGKALSFFGETQTVAYQICVCYSNYIGDTHSQADFNEVLNWCIFQGSLGI